MQIYNILTKCKLNNLLFNTQHQNDLGGCRCVNDIECNLFEDCDIPIEIKKMNSPDWMQCSLKYNENIKKWLGSSKNKIPDNSKKIFEEIISDINLFNGNIPPFIIRDITHEEWIKIKKESNVIKIHI
jgi:hypothetical protein